MGDPALSEIDFLRITAFIIATGGALEVLRRYIVAPIVAFVRLIIRALGNVEKLLERTAAIEETVEEMKTDVAEIKGALRAVGLLPGEDE